MSMKPVDAEILRRHFVAVATSDYDDIRLNPCPALLARFGNSTNGFATKRSAPDASPYSIRNWRITRQSSRSATLLKNLNLLTVGAAQMPPSYSSLGMVSTTVTLISSSSRIVTQVGHLAQQ